MHEPESLRASVEKSLQELKTTSVHIFYLHAADRSVPFEKTLRMINELHLEGKFERFGLSNFTSFEVAEIVMLCMQNGWIRPTLYQAMYNAISKIRSSHMILSNCLTSFRSEVYRGRIDSSLQTIWVGCSNI